MVIFVSLLGFLMAACCGCNAAGATGAGCACAGLCCCCFCAYSSKIRSFAAAIANAEGFGISGAIPTRNNNPGDLTISGDAGKDANGYGVFSTPAKGWQALYHQVSLYVAGTSTSGINLNSTISQLAYKYTGTQPAVWAQNIANYLGGTPSDRLSQWLV